MGCGVGLLPPLGTPLGAFFERDFVLKCRLQRDLCMDGSGCACHPRRCTPPAAWSAPAIARSCPFCSTGRRPCLGGVSASFTLAVSTSHPCHSRRPAHHSLPHAFPLLQPRAAATAEAAAAGALPLGSHGSSTGQPAGGRAGLGGGGGWSGGGGGGGQRLVCAAGRHPHWLAAHPEPRHLLPHLQRLPVLW